MCSPYQRSSFPCLLQRRRRPARGPDCCRSIAGQTSPSTTCQRRSRKPGKESAARLSERLHLLVWFSQHSPYEFVQGNSVPYGRIPGVGNKTPNDKLRMLTCVVKLLRQYCGGGVLGCGDFGGGS